MHSLLLKFLLVLCAGISVPSRTLADDWVTGDLLNAGKLAEAKTRLVERLRTEPENDNYRLELGMVQFFQAIESMGQSLYRFRPQDNIGMGLIPLLRIPVPTNPRPDEVRLDDIRAAMQQVGHGLDECYETIAAIDDSNVKLSAPIFQVHFDLDRNGKTSEEEQLFEISKRLISNRLRNRGEELAETAFDFDMADAEWLKGYCCLLRAVVDTFLAYDQSLFWDTVGHRLFYRGIVKHDFLMEEDQSGNMWNQPTFFIDIVAAIHNAQFRLEDPKRLKKAHAYLLQTIGHSRKMWELMLNEKDNQNEWIPSPKQSGGLGGVLVTTEMATTWGEFLDEAELLLTGKKLAPFWRGDNEKRGINLHRVFHEPINMDVVQWVHGTGAAPFIEIGDCSDAETWQEFQRVFRGNFFGFAAWFN